MERFPWGEHRTHTTTLRMPTPAEAETRAGSKVPDPWLFLFSFKQAGGRTFTNLAGRVITNDPRSLPPELLPLPHGL